MLLQAVASFLIESEGLSREKIGWFLGDATRNINIAVLRAFAGW
jgi:hypothetical protein